MYIVSWFTTRTKVIDSVLRETEKEAIEEIGILTSSLGGGKEIIEQKYDYKNNLGINEHDGYARYADGNEIFVQTRKITLR